MQREPQTQTSDGRIVLVGSYLVALVMDAPRIPVAGETLVAENFRQVHGGKGSNMAVQAARLGADVSFVGCVGEDDFAAGFVELMHTEGVDTGYLKQRGELPTGAGFIIVSAEGTNIITIDVGANALFSPADIDDAASVMTDGSVVLMPLEIPLETALHAAKRGAEAGCTVIFNPAPAMDLSGCDLSAIDILTPNETEARVCLGRPPDDPAEDVEIAHRLLDLGCTCVAMTLGERGCLIVSADGVIEVPAPKLASVVDSTGAGDAFNAALATRLLEGAAVAEAARFACAAAALCCTVADTIPSYHKRDVVERFLERAAGA